MTYSQNSKPTIREKDNNITEDYIIKTEYLRWRPQKGSPLPQKANNPKAAFAVVWPFPNLALWVVGLQRSKI